MFEDAPQARPVHLDRTLELAAIRQFLREPAARVDVAGKLHFGAGAPQFAVRIDHALHAAAGAPCGPAAEQVGQELDDDVGERARHGQQADREDPQHVASGLDDVNDETGLYQQMQDDDRQAEDLRVRGRRGPARHHCSGPRDCSGLCDRRGPRAVLVRSKVAAVRPAADVT